jgi:hypothetical protein
MVSFGDTSVNGQRVYQLLKTVGYIYNRDRLGRLWVPETELNVQSDLYVKTFKG